MSKDILKKAVELAGGQAHLARGIRERIPGSKICQTHVYGWLNIVKIEVPPPDVVLAIADFLEYRITPHQLRPDIYPNPDDAMPSPQQRLADGERREIERRAADRRAAELPILTFFPQLAPRNETDVEV